MEAKTMSLRQLRGALREHGVSQYDFAQVAGMRQPTVAATLRGELAVGPERKAQIEAAIIALRLHEPTTPGPNEVVFTIPAETATAGEGE